MTGDSGAGRILSYCVVGWESLVMLFTVASVAGQEKLNSR